MTEPSSAHSLAPDERPPAPLPTTSRLLLSLLRRGDASVWNQLVKRMLPALSRWARGRLPRWARRRVDTDDLVQEAFVNLLRRLGGIVPPRSRHALRAYLQESIRNRIRDEVRRAGRVEVTPAATPDYRDLGSSPLDRTLASETVSRYRAALARLDAGEQELIVGRIELGLSYQQLALATGRPSPDAARVAVRRALLRLAEEIPAD
jgi:RNA polymerase sigma-70 factor (ECF subfamily)